MMSTPVVCVCIFLDIFLLSQGFVQLNPSNSSLSVPEGGGMKICAKAAVSVPLHEFPVILSITFKFFSADKNNIDLLELTLEGVENQKCLEVAMQSITEKEFSIDISVPGYDSIPTTSQWDITILSTSRGKPPTVLAMVEVCEEIDLVMPATVEVPEGSTAELCIAAKFPTCSLVQQHKVKLRVEDISTSFEDFDHSSVPHTILLESNHSSQCLHIPTYISKDGPDGGTYLSKDDGGHKNFTIIATPGEFRVMVSLLKHSHSYFQVKQHVRRRSADCTRGDILPLLGGASTREGLVMVCSENQYFPVDISTFTIIEASVVCKNLQLGLAGFPLSAAQDFGVHAFTQLTSPSGRIRVQCVGDELSLRQCMIEELTYNLSDAAGVSCRDAVKCKDGNIRLVPLNQQQADQMQVIEGRLEICFHGIWGAVFDKDWSPNDVLVACRQLGFRSSIDVIPLVPAIDTNFLPVVYDSPACASITQSLLDCPREQITLCPGQAGNGGRTGDLSGVLGQLTDQVAIVGTRAQSGVVGIRCSLQGSSTCEEFDVRLTSQTQTTAAGNLEICYQNSWHRICNNLFEATDLDVACRSLGFVAYENISTVQHRLITPRIHTSGLPFLRKFNCSGIEEHFSQCNSTEETSGTCASSLSIECLAPPRVTFHPHLEAGIYHVQENRSASLECIIEEGTYPAVTNITTSVATSVMGLREMENTGAFPPYCLSAMLYSTQRAAVEDSGEYSCIVNSGGLVTIHTVYLKVQTPSAYGEAQVTEYLRFSALNILPLSPEQLIYSSLSTNLPGQQLVQCRQVQKKPTGQADDRYECAITTFASHSKDVMVSIAEAAALLLNNLKPFPNICCVKTSSSRFCDFEQTQFEGIEYSWPELAGGQSYTLPCPAAYNPNQVISRSCDPASGRWLPANTSLCKNVLETINEILDQQVTAEVYSDQVGVVAATLQRTVLEQSEQSDEILGAVVVFLDAVVAVAEENESIPIQVVEGLVDSLSSLQQWQTRLLIENRGTIARITNLFEQSATQFAGQLSASEIVNVTIPDQIIFAAENAEVASLQQTGRTYLVRKNMFMASENLEDLADDDITGSITLPSNLFASIKKTSEVGIFFTLYSDGALFQTRDPSTPTLSSVQRDIVGSPVVATTVVSDVVITNITPPVLLQFRLNPPNKGVRVNGSEECVWWDFSAAEGLGSWSSEGCTTLTAHSNDDIVECHCTHLTNFAILVDICSRLEDCADDENPVLSKTLSFITYIGTGFSMLGLILSVITLLAFKRLRQQEASKLHLQLCVSLFFLLLVFVSGAEATELYAGCVTVSVLLHYLTLTALLWMAAEALFMCKKLVFVFHKNSSRFIIAVSLFCWGAPLIPVSIPLVVDLSQGPDPAGDLIIRRDAFCFLSHTVVFWAAFMAPVLVILLLNLVFYIVVVVILLRHTRSTLLRRQEGLTTRITLRVMASIISILFLFGLTWLFAALTLTIHELRQTAQILFTIFNSFQGVFLFMFFCLLNQEARESWKEFLSCGHYKSALLRPHLRSVSYEVNKKRSASIQSDMLHNVTAFDNNKCYVPSASSLKNLGECVHRTLPLPSTPSTPLTPPSDTTIPLSTDGHHEEENSHTLNNPKGDITNLPAGPAWEVPTPLGARVKRISTLSQHVEEFQLDFLESGDTF